MEPRPNARILVVEDRDPLRRMLATALQGEGYHVETAADGPAGIAVVTAGRFDLLLTDLKLPGASGLEVLQAARARHPTLPVVVLTGYGTVPVAVEAMRAGAFHFLEKPVDLETLFALVQEALGSPRDVPAPRAGESRLVGRHPAFLAAVALLDRVAPTGSTVLLTGASGTGKELFARALHARSTRSAGPFVAVNCAAIPEPLVENELFGHEKGAFTGADRRQAGRFELADGGTLFLDEVGELPLGVQGKLLRALEERRFERVGGGKTLTANVRLVAATNRSLNEMVAAGSFRGDLYFRLNVFPIHLPSLAERAQDIPELARHLLGEIAARHQRSPLVLDPAAEALLTGHSWPGNVRELGNVLERAVILGTTGELTAADLKPLLHPLERPAAAESERERLMEALRHAEGDRYLAAERLGWSYRTLLRRVRQYALEGYPAYWAGGG